MDFKKVSRVVLQYSISMTFSYASWIRDYLNLLSILEIWRSMNSVVSNGKIMSLYFSDMNVLIFLFVNCSYTFVPFWNQQRYWRPISFCIPKGHNKNNWTIPWICPNECRCYCLFSRNPWVCEQSHKRWSKVRSHQIVFSNDFSGTKISKSLDFSKFWKIYMV